MLAQAHHLADEKRAIDESRDRLKAMKLDLHNRVANYNRLVNKFEANKKEPSAYEAVNVEPPVPLRPLKQAEEVSALEAKVAELQQQLANSKASASLNMSSEAAGSTVVIENTVESRIAAKKANSLDRIMHMIRQSLPMSGGMSDQEKNWNPATGKTRVKKEKKDTKAALQGKSRYLTQQVKTKQQPRSKVKVKRAKKDNFSGSDAEEALAEVEEGNEDEGEDYEDVEDLEEEDENENSEEDKQKVDEEAKPTLNDVLRDNSWASRVKKCGELDGKSLETGTIFVRKFNEGWFAAKIEQYRHNKVRSNCSVVCRDIGGKWEKDERNMLLKRDEYFSGADTLAKVGSWFFLKPK